MLSVRMVCQGTGPCGDELGATKMTKYTLGSTMKRMQCVAEHSSRRPGENLTGLLSSMRRYPRGVIPWI